MFSTPDFRTLWRHHCSGVRFSGYYDTLADCFVDWRASTW